MLQKKLPLLVVGLVIGGLATSAKAGTDGFIDKDTCKEFKAEFFVLDAPEDESHFMPRFKGIPDSLPEPGPLPNNAVVFPRKTKCWLWAQLLMAQAYPQIAEDITAKMLSEQEKYYEDELASKQLATYAKLGAFTSGGLLAGILLTLILVR